MRQYPPGFLSLSASVACERFSFFLLLSLLLLYLTEPLGFTTARATDVLGCFIAATYVSPLLGGVLADGRLGIVRTASLGYLVGAAGYALLLVPEVPALYLGLALIAIGSGSAKSAPQALAARMYVHAPDQRDGGLTLIYLLANASAVVSPVIGETAHSWLGWPAAFAVASLGLLASWGILRAQWAVLRATEQIQPVISDAGSATPHGSLRLLLGICLISLIFTVAHTQSSSTLLLWARDHTNRRMLGWELPVPYIASIHAALVIAVSPLVSRALSRLRTTPGLHTILIKIAMGLGATSLAFVPMVLAAHIGTGRTVSGLGWILCCLALLSVAELLIGALGPSFMLRLAPAQTGGRWLGVWFLATAAGFWLAGRLGALWDQVPHELFFAVLAGLPLFGVAICRMLVRRATTPNGHSSALTNG